MNTEFSALRSTRRRQMSWLCGAVFSFGTAVAQPAITNTTDASATVHAALMSWVDAFNHAQPTGVYFVSEAVLVRGNGTFSGAAVIEDMNSGSQRPA